MSIESVMPSNHLILCCSLLLPSIFPSIRVFSKESALHIRGPKYYSFSIHPSNEYPRLISLRIDWLDLLAIQGTLKSLPNTTVQRHQFLGAQLSLWSNSHISTRLLEKSYLWLDRPLFANWYLCFLIQCLGLSQLSFQGASVLISWLQSLSSVILESKKRESVTASTFPLLSAIKWWDQMPWS